MVPAAPTMPAVVAPSMPAVVAPSIPLGPFGSPLATSAAGEAWSSATILASSTATAASRTSIRQVGGGRHARVEHSVVVRTTVRARAYAATLARVHAGASRSGKTARSTGSPPQHEPPAAPGGPPAAPPTPLPSLSSAGSAHGTGTTPAGVGLLAAAAAAAALDLMRRVFPVPRRLRRGTGRRSARASRLRPSSRPTGSRPRPGLRQTLSQEERCVSNFLRSCWRQPQP